MFFAEIAALIFLQFIINRFLKPLRSVIETAKNIGEGTQITTRDAIKVAQVGAACNLKSTNYGFTAKNIGSRVTINVRDAIEVENIGDFCTISSSQYGIKGHNVGIKTTINVRDAISLHDIGTESVVTSAQYGLDFGHLSGHRQLINQ